MYSENNVTILNFYKAIRGNKHFVAHKNILSSAGKWFFIPRFVLILHFEINIYFKACKAWLLHGQTDTIFL